ncbi:MAG TPA: putative glycoside hydrolase [Deltaproteobacteria bacterium]|nr:putative glycoside hydrolase [Deltaproteobacteria bacterium]HQI80164.1 putative glycoside hydrolase [Deltaproteobacteria bacterium]
MRIAVHCLCIMMFCLASVQLHSAEPASYMVKQGDSLGKIAYMYLPLAAAYTNSEFVEQIKKANNIGNEGLSVGQVLTIPLVRTEPVRPVSVKRSRTFEAKGAYANQFTAGSRQVLAMGERLVKNGANTVVFDAKEVEGLPTYRSAVQRQYTGADTSSAAIDDISKLVDYLHRQGVHVVARVCMFRDIHNSTRNEAWRFDKEWVNPASRAVQDYNLAVIRELIGFGVDEIQVDYFRYPADGKTHTGVEGKSRSDVLTEYAARIHELTASKGVLLSLDMFGIVIWQKDEDIRILGQDVMRFKDHFDIISPMLYPSHFVKNFSGIQNPADEPYMFVHAGVKRMKALVGDRVVIRPWLQSFPLRVTIGYTPSYIKEQIRAAGDAGAVGWLLWSPGNKYAEAFRALEDLAGKSRPTGVKTTQVTTGGVAPQVRTLQAPDRLP